MDTLRTSSKVRLWFPRDEGESVCYEVAGSIVGLDRPRSSERLYRQLRNDGIAPNELQSYFRSLISSCPEIEKIGITFSGNEYSIMVVARTLSDAEVVDVRYRMNGFLAWFPGGAARISIFGPSQRDSILFEEAMVVHNRERNAA